MLSFLYRFAVCSSVLFGSHLAVGSDLKTTHDSEEKVHVHNPSSDVASEEKKCDPNPTPPAEASSINEHKPLFPLHPSDISAAALCFVGLMVAAGGGIGGGGFAVPMFVMVLHFSTKHAVALSNATIFGGSLANLIFNLRKTTEVGGKQRSVIDWDIILLMEPTTIAGALIGTYLQVLFPNIVLTSVLALILGYMCFDMMLRAEKRFKAEKKKTGSVEGKLSEDSLVEDEKVGGLKTDAERTNQEENRISNFGKFMRFLPLYLGSILLIILKGGGSFAPIADCGTLGWWLLSLAVIPVCVGFFFWYRKIVLDDPTNSVVAWNETNSLTYPLLCTLAGLFAGLFGVGGAIVKGPLMLALGVEPAIASASAATMIVFTASTALISYFFFNQLVYDYAAALFVMGFVATGIGQLIVSRFFRRQSAIVFSIAIVIGLSCVAMAVLSATRGVSAWRDGTLWDTGSLCPHEGGDGHCCGSACGTK